MLIGAALEPFDPLTYVAHLAFAIAAVDEGRYDQSAAWWEKCSQANPDFGGFSWVRQPRSRWLDA